MDRKRQHRGYRSVLTKLASLPSCVKEVWLAFKDQISEVIVENLRTLTILLAIINKVIKIAAEDELNHTESRTDPIYLRNSQRIVLDVAHPPWAMHIWDVAKIETRREMRIRIRHLYTLEELFNMQLQNACEAFIYYVFKTSIAQSVQKS